MPDDLSATMREYLAEINRLSERGPQLANGYISTSALADMLDVSAPAVNRMINRLKEIGLLEHEPYQGIRLTPAGERAARIELRRHRIAEAFLVNVMGFGWHEIHEEAHHIGGALSDVLVERMAAMAGNPTHCPHGEPIPDADGEVEPLDDRPLAAVQDENTALTVTRILTREPERLEYLAALGLLPGTPVVMLHAAPFNGPMQLKVGEEYRIVGHNLAEMVCVSLA